MAIADQPVKIGACSDQMQVSLVLIHSLPCVTQNDCVSAKPWLENQSQAGTAVVTGNGLCGGRLQTQYQPPRQSACTLSVPAEQADNLEVRYQLCALKLINDDYEGAMELLPEILRNDSGFRNGAARYGVPVIFGLLGNQGELVDLYRELLVQYLH